MSGGVEGQVVILNGAPRSGKSSIAKAMQASASEPWLHLGVDAYADHILPERLYPGIGLRPGGERPDLEPVVSRLFLALYETVAAHARLGFNMVLDVGHHEDFSQDLNMIGHCAKLLDGLDVLFVGLLCDDEEIARRRASSVGARPLLAFTSSGDIAPEVLRFNAAVHRGKTYDLTLRTDQFSAVECAEMVLEALTESRATRGAFLNLAEGVMTSD